MSPEEAKVAAVAMSKELANQRRIITQLEIENDELKQKIKEFWKSLNVLKQSLGMHGMEIDILFGSPAENLK